MSIACKDVRSGRCLRDREIAHRVFMHGPHNDSVSYQGVSCKGALILGRYIWGRPLIRAPSSKGLVVGRHIRAPSYRTPSYKVALI